jgi:hypothetical protein
MTSVALAAGIVVTMVAMPLVLADDEWDGNRPAIEALLNFNFSRVTLTTEKAKQATAAPRPICNTGNFVCHEQPTRRAAALRGKLSKASAPNASRITLRLAEFLSSGVPWHR